jgi:hypothetical protein
MMLLGAEHAVVDAAKVRDYLLSHEHPVGRFKAVFFETLGYSKATWPRLQNDLLALCRTAAAVEGQSSEFGRKYEVRGTLVGPSGRSAEVHSRGDAMKFKQLDTVVLDRDVPESGLRKGDLGAVVQTYEPDGLEVEFVTASGRTQALVTLRDRDVRPVMDQDLISVRPLTRGAA